MRLFEPVPVRVASTTRQQRKRSHRRVDCREQRATWLLAGVALFAVAVMALAAAPRARAQDRYHAGHAEFHDVYRGWVQNNGFSSCCNGDDPETGVKGDCRPAKAYRDPDDDLWRVLIRGTWRIVPPRAVRPYMTPDGNSHVCEDEHFGIMCFVGGLPKS